MLIEYLWTENSSVKDTVKHIDMELIDYYNAELRRLDQRISSYTEYGYSDGLEPIVKALKKCFNEIMEAKWQL